VWSSFRTQMRLPCYIVGGLGLRSELGHDRVGGGVASAVLPHHRAYGSVPGGSRNALKLSQLTLQRHESELVKECLAEGIIYVRGS
jgi:hypothetical protein